MQCSLLVADAFAGPKLPTAKRVQNVKVMAALTMELLRGTNREVFVKQLKQPAPTANELSSACKKLLSAAVAEAGGQVTRWVDVVELLRNVEVQAAQNSDVDFFEDLTVERLPFYRFVAEHCADELNALIRNTAARGESSAHQSLEATSPAPATPSGTITQEDMCYKVIGECELLADTAERSVYASIRRRVYVAPSRAWLRKVSLATGDTVLSLAFAFRQSTGFAYLARSGVHGLCWRGPFRTVGRHILFAVFAPGGRRGFRRGGGIVKSDACCAVDHSSNCEQREGRLLW